MDFTIPNVSMNVMVHFFIVLQGGLVSRLLGLFQLMDEQPHFLHLWNRLASRGVIKVCFVYFSCLFFFYEVLTIELIISYFCFFQDFLLTMFQLINELVTKMIYPEEWSIMTILANQIILKALQVSLFLFFGVLGSII